MQNKQGEDYQLDEGPPDHFIIISLAQLSTQWYSVGLWALSILFLGDWKRYMAPPSLLKFIVTLVIVQTIFAMSPRHDRSKSHLGTKGCIGDFNNELVDTRYKALQGYICEYCRDTIRQNGVEHVPNDLVRLLSRSGWVQRPTLMHLQVSSRSSDMTCLSPKVPTRRYGKPSIQRSSKRE